MEELINYVSQTCKLPRAVARTATLATLDFLQRPFTPRLLQIYIDVTLHYPNLTPGEKDFLIASRILFPSDPNANSGTADLAD